MDMKNFYSLESKLLSTTFQAHPQNQSLDELNNLVLGKLDKINLPIIFKQEYGKKLTDLLDTGFAYLYLISEKMLSVLKENKISGWDTFSVNIFDKKGNKIKGYYGFSITGKSGAIDYSKSDIIEKRFVPEGPIGKYYKGQYFGYEKWDGSDFFITEGSFHIIITKNAMQILKKAKLTNINFTCLTDIEIPDFALKK